MANGSNTGWVRTLVKGLIIVSFVGATISPNGIKDTLATTRLRLNLGRYPVC